MSGGDDEDEPVRRTPRRPGERGLHRSYSRGVPIVRPDDAALAGTAPWVLIDRELTTDEAEVVRRSKRNSGDPATVADLVKLAARAARMAAEERSAQRKIELDAAALLELPQTVRKLQADARLLRRIAYVILTTALGALGLVADRLWDRAEREGETAIRLQHVEQAVERLLRDRTQSPKDFP